MNARHRASAAMIAVMLVLTISLATPVSAHGLTASQAASPIYIGALVPLTGARANPGGPATYQMAGAKLALAQINAQGGINGHPLTLVVADDQSTNRGALAALERLVQANHVSAILGPNLSKEIQALTPAIKHAGIPMIIGGQAPILTHEGDPWVFRTRPNQTVEAQVLTAFAVVTLHLTKIALIHANDTAGTGAEAAQLADLHALGVTPVADQSYPNQAADMTAQLQAIKTAGATGLMSEAAFPEDYVLMVRQMQQVGLHLTLIGNPVLVSAPILQKGGPGFYGTYSASDYVAGQSPEAAAFDKASEARYHLPGDFASAYVYDGLNILAQVMRQVGIAPRAIRQGLLAVTGYRGAEGTYNFDRNGDGLHQDTLVQNVHGQLRIIKVFTF